MCWFDRNTARRGLSVVPLTCRDTAGQERIASERNPSPHSHRESDSTLWPLNRRTFLRMLWCRLAVRALRLS
jgi:hypothetical protein